MPTPNLLDPATFEQNPYFIRPGETSEQYTARTAAPLKVSATPTAPAAPNYAATAAAAGKAGLGASDYASLLGATPDEQKAAKDEIAKQFGYDNADAFFMESLQKPSKTTEDFYNRAYSAAGLDKNLREIRSKREMLNRALGVVNDNPWLDEASRSGKAGRLQQLANADIQNLENEYQLRLDKVHDLVASHADDIGQDEKIRAARLAYLESATKEKLGSLQDERARSYFNDYVSGIPQDTTPKTVSVSEGEALYQWNPTTQDFELVTSRPKTYAPGSGVITGASDPTVEYYADLLRTGKITLSNVPQKIRNAVVLASKGDINARLSDTAIKEIQQSESAIANLEALRSTMEANLQYVGPISGLSALNPYSKARQVQSEIDRVRQQVGKTLEGGVLRKEDEDKYKKILATLNDTPETALVKIDNLIQSIQRDVDSYRSIQSDTGRYVPGSNQPQASAADIDYTIKQNSGKFPTREALIDAIVASSGAARENVASRVYKLIPDKK